ncbi:MAG: HlyC/CorC family transporter [Kiritimatiellae bacterium]|nr:HlyC/CorC family transporter [Kiritimatiellia bacterium]
MFITLSISGLLVLFLFSAFFSASETVLFSLTPLQVRRLKDRRPSAGSRIAGWLENPSRVLSTILAGNTFVNFAIAGLGYLLLEQTVPVYADVVSVPLYTLLLLVFGEILPKQLALRHAERLAPWCARALNVFLFALAPFSRLMVIGSSVFENLLTRERRALSDDEMRTIIESAAASGELDSEEASMVEGVMRLPDLYALNEMTPRVHLVGVEASLPDAEKVAAAEASDYPFLPVYRGDMDHVEGFLDTERLLADPARRVRDAVERPLRVSEHEGLDDLLVKFMKTGRKIALVTDRWGGTAGIITRGDILELIVKPVVDEDEEEGL